VPVETLKIDGCFFLEPGGVWADATYINLNYRYVIPRCLGVKHACVSATKAPNAAPFVLRMMEKDRNGDMGVRWWRRDAAYVWHDSVMW
jgi:hypothetical protein